MEFQLVCPGVTRRHPETFLILSGATEDLFCLFQSPCSFANVCVATFFTLSDSLPVPASAEATR